MASKIEFSKYLKKDVNERQYLGTRQPDIRRAWANLSPREREAQKVLALIWEIDEMLATQNRLSQPNTE